MQRTAPPFLLLLLLFVLAAAWLTPVLVWAAPEDGEGEVANAAEERDTAAANSRLTMEELEKLIMERGATATAMILGRILPMVAGLVLLILWLVRQSGLRERIRSGHVAAPAPTPPPMLFDLAQSILLPLICLAVLPILGAAVLVAAYGNPESTPLGARLGLMFCVTMPLALLAVMRHRRLSEPAPPGLGGALKIGLWAFCVAQLIALPLALVWTILLKFGGYEPQVQQLVQDTIFSPDISKPLMITIYGVLVAPFVEEAIFRGILYPAIRNAFGKESKRTGIVVGIVITSVLFALVHDELSALVPLFGLAVVLNLVYEKTNSLAACVIAHAAFNATTLIPLLLLQAQS